MTLNNTKSVFAEIGKHYEAYYT